MIFSGSVDRVDDLLDLVEGLDGRANHRARAFGDGEAAAAELRVVAARLEQESPGAESAQQALPGLGGVTPSPMVLVATARGYGFRTTPDLTETTRAGRRLARPDVA